VSIPVSVCGIIAKHNWDAYAWETRFDHTVLAEPDPAVAHGFIEADVTQEGLGVAEAINHFLIARVHPGHILRCDDPRMRFTDFAIQPAVEMEHWLTEDIWTVCGIRQNTGIPYSQPWCAHGPALALLAAWHQVAAEGDNLLLANVHPGDVNGDAEQINRPLCDQLALAYADPSCHDDAAMRQLMREWTPEYETEEDIY